MQVDEQEVQEEESEPGKKEPKTLQDIFVESVKITGTRDLEPRIKWSGDESEKYKVYVMESVANGNTYPVSHRYTEFQDLNYYVGRRFLTSQLKATFPDVVLPAFPPATLFRAGKKDVDKRIRMFGQYFRELLSDKFPAEIKHVSTRLFLHEG